MQGEVGVVAITMVGSLFGPGGLKCVRMEIAPFGLGVPRKTCFLHGATLAMRAFFPRLHLGGFITPPTALRKCTNILGYDNRSTVVYNS